uniref:Gelsolin-like domain-containing protein n=1 Tax=Heterorhabditis bacteriophora TaxID=37862 RepID=A0A1I7XNX6_HETBA
MCVLVHSGDLILWKAHRLTDNAIDAVGGYRNESSELEYLFIFKQC